MPLRGKFDLAIGGNAKLILVFTQERLHLLSNALGDAAGIDLLIVDEAHKIGDNQRGVLLQDAIERASRANPRLKVVFSKYPPAEPGAFLCEPLEAA